MHQKGQVLILEQIVLFGMGVTIFVACFAAFSVYQSHFSAVAANDQLVETKDAVVSNILKLYQKDASESTIKMDIPENIAGSPYIIHLGEGGLDITIQSPEELSIHSSVFNLAEKVDFSGSVTSTSGRLMIYKKGNEIILM